MATFFLAILEFPTREDRSSKNQEKELRFGRDRELQNREFFTFGPTQAAGPGEVHAVSLRRFNTIEHYFVEGLTFDLIKIYISDLEFGMRIAGTVVTFSTVVSVLSSLLVSVGLTFWAG